MHGNSITRGSNSTRDTNPNSHHSMSSSYRARYDSRQSHNQIDRGGINNDEDKDELESDSNSTEDEDLEVDLEDDLEDSEEYSLGEDEEDEDDFYSERDNDEDIEMDEMDEVQDLRHGNRERYWTDHSHQQHQKTEEFHSPGEASEGEVEIEINPDRQRNRNHFSNRRTHSGEEIFERGIGSYYRQEQHILDDDDDEAVDETNDIEDDLETSSSNED